MILIAGLIFDRARMVNLDAFTFQSTRKRENLAYDIGTPLGANLNGLQDFRCLRIL